MVLSGSVESIALTILDAMAADEPDVFVLTASGRPARLPLRDAGGEPVQWRLREVAW